MPELEQESKPALPQSNQPSTPLVTGVAESKPFKFGDSAPEYLRGKTEAEAIDWTTRLVNEVQQVVANAQPAASPPENRTMTQQIGLPNADEALTNPDQYQQKLAAYFAAQTQVQVNQAAASIAPQLAETAKSLSKMDPKNGDIWTKYGAEVDTLISSIPLHMRTQQLYDNACRMVRGEHVDELVAEKATKLAAAGGGLARSSDGGSEDGTPEADTHNLWEKIGKSAVGAATIDAIGKKGIMKAIDNGVYKSLEDYAEQVSKTKTRVNTAGKAQELYTRG